MDKNKKLYNAKYSDYYFRMSKDFIKKKGAYFKRGSLMGGCLNYWLWDKYQQNKILDLKVVNRCKNNRFCTNCKILDTSKFAYVFKEQYEDLLKEGYKAYFLTLTIPSMDGEMLREGIDALSVNFNKLMKKFMYNDKNAFTERLMDVEGGVRVLEITHSNISGFHPHLHCIVFTMGEIDSEVLIKNIKGKFSRKRNTHNYKSELDCQIGKLWSMIYYGDRLTKYNIDNMVYDPEETFYADNKKNLEVDIRELDEQGIKETFKYTFKDTDIESYEVFSDLVLGLESKRIRQGFGVLLNMKCEDVEVGEEQELVLEIEENPVELITNEIIILTTEYADYKKISRFKAPMIDIE